MAKCIFCGDYAGANIRVPYEYVMGYDNKEAKAYIDDLSILLPCCIECREVLDGVPFTSLERAAQYLALEYGERYAHLLSTLKWTRSELSELGHNLRTTIELSQRAQLEVKDRVDQCERVRHLGPDISDELREEIEFEVERHRKVESSASSTPLSPMHVKAEHANNSSASPEVEPAGPHTPFPATDPALPSAGATAASDLNTPESPASVRATLIEFDKLIHAHAEVLRSATAANFQSRSSKKLDNQTPPEGASDGLDDLLSFQADEEPEDFFARSSTKTASGTFVTLVSPALTASGDADADWELDLSPAQIAGEGIGPIATVTPNHGAENDFLRVGSRGRRSAKRAVVQTGTRLSINPKICMTWVEDILAKGWFSTEEMETLLALCEGNGDPEELRINLQRNLEAAGLDLVDQASVQDGGLWEAKSETSPDELAEAIEAALTRATRLPGTQRFVMDKSNERQLLEPMVRAKQELQLSILACETALETILEAFDKIRDGSRDPESVSLRSISPSRPSHSETAEVFAAAESLKIWHTNGRAMDGKRRREALAALEALDLSLTFYKELVAFLKGQQTNIGDAIRLDALISAFEAAAEHLIREHLSYARRFAARNVEEGEDPEDVFQVACTGLQRSTRRFDPERGVKFSIYSAWWMKQALTRWRADEGAEIRVPVHRHENLAKFDRAMDSLDIRADGAVSDNDLSVELGWTADEVRQFRRIPRQGEYPENIDAWDDLLPEPEDDANIFNQADTKWIAAEALAELQERQADVIRMRFGIGRDAEMTLEEIGQLYGVTRERIRQIEAKALGQLSHPSRMRRLKALLGM